VCRNELLNLAGNFLGGIATDTGDKDILIGGR
jgi:hypothetical protein